MFLEHLIDQTFVGRITKTESLSSDRLRWMFREFLPMRTNDAQTRTRSSFLPPSAENRFQWLIAERISVEKSEIASPSSFEENLIEQILRPRNFSNKPVTTGMQQVCVDLTLVSDNLLDQASENCRPTTGHVRDRTVTSTTDHRKCLLVTVSLTLSVSLIEFAVTYTNAICLAVWCRTGRQNGWRNPMWREPRSVRSHWITNST